MAMNKFWRMVQAQGEKHAEIYLYDQIGKDYFSDEGIAAKDFVADLKALGPITDIDLRIASPGGSVFEGLVIYNSLMQHPAKKHVYIDGVAASMGAYIALCGNDIHMPGNAMMMFHGSQAMVVGNAKDMRDMADVLDKTNESLKSILKTRAKCDEKKMDAILAEDTWLTAQECKDLGLCDEIMEPAKMAAHVDLSKFKNVPAALLASATNPATAQATAGASPVVEAVVIPRPAQEPKQEPKATVTTPPKGATKMKCPQCGNELAEGAKCGCPTAVAARMSEVNDILAMAEKHNNLPLAKKLIAEGKGREDFAMALLEAKGAKPIPEPTASTIGMDDKDMSQYSIVRAMRQMIEHGRVDGLEKEASEATAKICKTTPKGFFIPTDIMRTQALKQKMQSIRAALGVSPGSSGGYLIGTDVLVQDMIEILRNKTMVSRLGARTLSGLVGNVAIPRQSGGATAYWLSADGAGTPSDQTLAQLGLTPHRLVGDTVYQKELLMQTSLDVEGFVRGDLMSVLAIAKDLAALNGAGGTEPLGIINTTGINSVTFGAAATYAKLVDFETQVANLNADLGALAYLTTPASRGKWKTATKISGGTTPPFIWETSPNGSPDGSGIVNGYRAEVTNQVPSNKVIFGNWNDLILADWAGVDVVVNPYTYAKQGLIEITITMWGDCGVRHAVSFTVSTDSGAQ